ncbi:MAG: M28 family peptidase [Xanthomonadales bacterium]|nr:M28 family peptidase [Xanthomonadales bacterium]
MMRSLLLLALCALLTACPSHAPPPQDAAKSDEIMDEPPPNGQATGPEISAEDFISHVRVLASDEFEGRAPGTKGEELTTAYLRDQFKRLGLAPGNGDSYFQTVPMVRTTADESVALNLRYADGTDTLGYGEQMVVGTSSGQTEVSIADSEMVFLGYGVDAPEAEWNDYSVDVTGKTVVVLVNDPGFHAGDSELFQGQRMTYYGRWSYKFEEAARKGAAAALVIHDDAGAGYGWEVVRNSWSGPQFDLPAEVDPAPRLPMQGWLSGEAARQLFARSGHDLAALRAAANKRGFKPVPLGVTLSATLHNEVATAESNNVLGLLRGREAPDEVVVYLGHWDHLGRNPELDGDGIYNGAIDNASGVAGILEIAEAFVTRAQAPRRSVLFMAVTLEESGLLGSKYYVANPVFPMAKTVAAVNLDAMHMPGRTRDMVVVGLGNSELEDLLAPIAAKQDRVLRPESALEKGFYYRSDHFNFAKAGVPAIYAKSGNDLREGGTVAGDLWAKDYNEVRYHRVDDEYHAGWNVSGVMEDLKALFVLGVQLAESDTWPNWFEGNEFRATREASRAEASSP